MGAPRRRRGLLAWLADRLLDIAGSEPPARPPRPRGVGTDRPAGQPVERRPVPPPPPVRRTPATERTTGQLVDLIGKLVRRPARTDRGLPLIRLVNERDGAEVLSALERNVDRTSSRWVVPHARIGAPPVDPADPGGVAAVRSLLDDAREQLSQQRFGGERLWFRHFGLVHWLMDQQGMARDPEQFPADLRKRLRERHRRLDQEDRSRHDAAVAALSAPYHLLLALLRTVVPMALFRAAMSGRIPGFGRRYRWFMRQQYLAPQQSVDFVGLAERLTNGRWRTENVDQLGRLLVHAFLEDLRQAYARRPWRVEGWRRTAYPLLMIDDAFDGTGGHRLLQLLGDVRNETGRWDPLLVVGVSDENSGFSDDGGGEVLPAGARAAGRDESALPESDPYFRQWAEALPQNRRARRRTAWNLPITVTDAAAAQDCTGQVIHSPKPPWFARRAVAVAVVLAVLAPLVAWIGWQAGAPGCLHRPYTGEISVREIDGECIGYTDNAAFRFDGGHGDGPLERVQAKIFEQNAVALRRWAEERRRPLVTIVYLGTLTGRTTNENEEAYAAEREELEGLAVAQHNWLQEPATAYSSPLLRVVVANGGFQMRHAEQVVPMLADLAERDPTVLAVVGLVESRANTAAALRMLNDIRLPVIAPTLSADEFWRNSRLYLQLVPPNQEQAAMFARYADSIGARTVRIYHTPGQDSTPEDDLYVSTLRAGLRTEFGDRIEYEQQFRPGDLLDRECGYDGMLIFAGRWSEFGAFLNGLKVCNDRPPLHLVANDSVNRYMANPALRAAAPNNVPLTFISKSQLGTCEHLQAIEDSGEADEVRNRFLRHVRTPGLLDPARCDDDGHPVGERVPLAYDAASLVLEAAQRLAGRLRTDPARQEWDPESITPVGVHAEILGRNRFGPFAGVTGDIAFEHDTGEPEDKRLSMLRVQSIPDLTTPITEVFHCGSVRVGDDPTCGSPGASSPR